MYAKEIAKGIAWLDSQNNGRQGWLPRVDIGSLNLAKGNTCMLGQLYGGFHRVVDMGGINHVMATFLNRALPAKTASWAVRHGFAVRGGANPITEIKYAILTLEWMRALKKLRAEEETPAPAVEPATPAPEPTPEPAPAEEVTAPEEVVESPFGTPSPLQMNDIEFSEVKNIKKKK